MVAVLNSGKARYVYLDGATDTMLCVVGSMGCKELSRMASARLSQAFRPGPGSNLLHYLEIS